MSSTRLLKWKPTKRRRFAMFAKQNFILIRISSPTWLFIQKKGIDISATYVSLKGTKRFLHLINYRLYLSNNAYLIDDNLAIIFYFYSQLKIGLKRHKDKAHPKKRSKEHVCDICMKVSTWQLLVTFKCNIFTPSQTFCQLKYLFRFRLSIVL